MGSKICLQTLRSGLNPQGTSEEEKWSIFVKARQPLCETCISDSVRFSGFRGVFPDLGGSLNSVFPLITVLISYQPCPLGFKLQRRNLQAGMGKGRDWGPWGTFQGGSSLRPAWLLLLSEFPITSS